MKLSLNSLCCAILSLKSRITAAEGTSAPTASTSLTGLDSRLDILEAINAAFVSGVAAGTAYSLTGTSAALDFGTTDPVVVIPSAGRWLLMALAQLDFAGATVSTQTAALKLRRTNNTAADITNAAIATLDLPVMTTLTHTFGVFHLPQVIYTTANTNDSLTIFGSLSATLGAGNLNAVAAQILAVKLSA